MNCPYCGMDSGPGEKICLVCGNELPDKNFEDLLVVDVAHNNETWEQARAKIDKALDTCLFEYRKGVKIIHGRGSHGFHTGVIAKKAIPYMKKLANTHGGRCVQDHHNSGAHIIYFF